MDGRLDEVSLDGPPRGYELPAIPPWVRQLGLPVWIIDPAQRIRFVNARATELLGLRKRECLGSPCFRVIDACDVRGERFCKAKCRVLRRVTSGGEVQPFSLQIASPNGSRWVRVLCIPRWTTDAAAPWLVHCALDDERTHRVEEWARRIASRTPPSENGHGVRELTSREREVLDHLALDEDPATIAAELHISVTTVRNHVQHILTALHVHSIPEAITRHLLAN